MRALAKYSLLITTLVGISTQYAFAQSTPIGQSGDWGMYLAGTAAERQCYAAAKPQDRSPANVKRDPAYIFISTRPAENVRQELSIKAGFRASPSNAWLITETSSFQLATRDTYLWIKDAGQNALAIQAIANSRSFAIKATSTNGALLTDTYSAYGLRSALNRVDQECRGVKPSAPQQTAKPKPSIAPPATTSNSTNNASSSNRTNDACKKFPDLC